MHTSNYLGKEVQVKIDRPLGSKHPKWGFTYPVNYGYIPNTESADGEELDAYVLGPTEPLIEYNGKVICIIHRVDDDDDKLVVSESDISNEEIEKLTEFQEKWFKHEIIR
jgi:inorganic pyrophosphatase